MVESHATITVIGDSLYAYCPRCGAHRQTDDSRYWRDVLESWSRGHRHVEGRPVRHRGWVP